MVSYGVIRTAEDSVVGALRREGGELCLAELLHVTHLPATVVERVVQQLVEKKVVHVYEHPGTGLKMIQLCDRRNPWQRALQWLGLASKV